MHPRIYADFHNADARGRLRLNCIGTMKDLSKQQVSLREGLILTLYADDANAEASRMTWRSPGWWSIHQTNGVGSACRLGVCPSCLRRSPRQR